MIQFLKKNYLLIAILFLAAFLRLYKISDYMEFLGDQGRDVVIVRDFLKNGNLFFIGPQTSIGNMYLGPFYYYVIMAPALLIANFNPVGPAIFVALLGVLTVYFAFYISQKWFNSKTAYISALLMAISPVIIKYSNFSWNPNILPLFSLLFIYFLWEKKIILATLSFIMAINSHYLALSLLPLALIIWFLKKYSFKATLIAILLFIFSLTPQILFDLKHQGQNIKSITTFFTQRETTVNLKPYKSLIKMPTIYHQLVTSSLSARNFNLGIAVSIFLLLGSVYLLVKKRTPALLLIVGWIISSVIILGLYKQHLYDHYFGFVFPAFFILTGYLLSKINKYLSIIILIILVSFSVLNTNFKYPGPKQLETTKTIVKQIISTADNRPFNFALLAKQNYDPGYRYFFYESQSPLKNIQEQLTDQLFVVCEPWQIDCQPINNPEWAVAAFGWAKIDKQWETNGIKIYQLSHTKI